MAQETVFENSIGSDAEIFVRDSITSDIISAVGIIPGDKHNQMQTEHGAMHRDNVMAEVNVNPANTKSQFINNVAGVLLDVRSYLRKRSLEIAIIPSNIMHNVHLQSLQAQEMGCEPDIDAWGVDGESHITPEEAGNLRTCGGHIHFGTTADNKTRMHMIMAADFTIGLPSVLLDPNATRRNLYGRMGHCRIKEHGVEYRVPSNFWLTKEAYVGWVFDAAQEAILNHEQLSSYFRDDIVNKVRLAINTSDAKLAETLVKELEIDVP